MSNWMLANPSALAAAAALCVLCFAESLFPFFAHAAPRTRHGVLNLTLGLINGLLRATFFPAALVVISGLGERYHTGLLRIADAPPWFAAAFAVLALDFVNYAWHIASHHWAMLWRFHAVHHHDNAVDATTAFRFHAGDVLINAAVTLATVGLLGLEVWHVLLYEAILLPLSLFHHSNIRIPESIDRPLRALIVTPRMHWVHHSRWFRETDSNFSGVFSFWDRAFGTFRLRPDPATLALGLDGYAAADLTLRGCLTTPLGPVRSKPGQAPEPGALGDVGWGGRRARRAALATDPSRGRHLPLAIAVARATPARTLPPCPTPDQQPQTSALTAAG